MTELYQAQADTGEYDDTAKDAPAPDRDHSQDRGDAGMQATLDHEDELPTRQDARAASWGEDPEYDDEENLSAEYDGDLDALTADDQLPTRQDARAATWGEDVGYYDENDPGTQYDGDLDALTAGEGQLPTRRGTHAATWDDNPDYYNENDPGTQDDGDFGAFADGEVLDSDQVDLDQTAADQATPATAGPDAPSAEVSDSQATLPAEQGDRSPADTSQRITGLEAENAQLGKTIADLQARLERLEQGGQERPNALISDRARDVDKLPEETTEPEHRRRLPSDARLALGGTITGIALSTAAEHMSAGPAHMTEYIGAALSVGIGAIAVWRENRNKDVHRPEN